MMTLMPKNKSTHHWSGIAPDPENFFGFVYCIRDFANHKYYIGKKQYHSYRMKTLKGRTNRKKYKSESDWRFYTGSNDKLNLQISRLGTMSNLFDFRIIYQFKTKGGLYYGECEAIMLNRAVVKEYYYNGQVSAIKFKPTEVVSDPNLLKINEDL